MTTRYSTRTIRATFAFSILAGLLVAIGFLADNNQLYVAANTIFSFLVVFITVFAFASLIFLAIIDLLSRAGVKSRAKFKKLVANPDLSIFFQWVISHSCRFAFAVLLVAWLPYLIAFFPGIMTYDTVWELFQAMGSGSLVMGREYPSAENGAFSDHKPLAHTLLIGLLFRLGSSFGSQTTGIFLITLLQYVLMAFAFARVVSYAYSVKKKTSIFVCTLVFFSFFPLFPFYAVSPFNDCVAVAFFSLWAIEFSKAVESKGDYLKNRKASVFMIVLAILASLFKKTNIYIIVLCCFVSLFFFRGNLFKGLAQLLIPACTCVILIPSVIYPALNVISGDKGEVLGTMLQQTVSYSIDHESELDVDERRTIGKMIDLDKAIQGYKATTFDYAKFYYLNSESTSELFDYLLLWAQQGLDDPLCYLRSFIMVEYPWFYPSLSIDLYGINYDATINAVAIDNSVYTNGVSLKIADSFDFFAPQELEPLRETITQAIMVLQSNTLGKIVFSTCGIEFWLPVLSLFLLGSVNPRERSLSFGSQLPCIISLFVLFLSPLVMCRYGLPVVALSPLIICGLASTQDEAK